MVESQRIFRSRVDRRHADMTNSFDWIVHLLSKGFCIFRVGMVDLELGWLEYKHSSHLYCLWIWCINNVLVVTAWFVFFSFIMSKRKHALCIFCFAFTPPPSIENECNNEKMLLLCLAHVFTPETQFNEREQLNFLNSSWIYVIHTETHLSDFNGETRGGQTITT